MSCPHTDLLQINRASYTLGQDPSVVAILWSQVAPCPIALSSLYHFLLYSHHWELMLIIMSYLICYKGLIYEPTIIHPVSAVRWALGL